MPGESASFPNLYDPIESMLARGELEESRLREGSKLFEELFTRLMRYIRSRDHGRALLQPQFETRSLVSCHGQDSYFNYDYPIWVVDAAIKNGLINVVRGNGDNVLWEIASRRLDPLCYHKYEETFPSEPASFRVVANQLRPGFWFA